MTATESPPSVNRMVSTDQATASSAHSRINMAVVLNNWRDLPEDQRQDLLWFHQHALDRGMTWDECAEALNYDKSTVFRALAGTYEGSWKNIQDAIRSYRRIDEERGQIQRQEFVQNSIARMIGAGLDYAVANNSITLVVGESRMGKTAAARWWRDQNNHGRSVLITAPAFGGTGRLLRDIAQAVGVSRNRSIVDIHDAILRAFNRNRILIVDEAHRLLPGDRRANPVNLEIIRDIHDRTGCAVALLATQRFDTELKRGEYMFEQLLGRIGMPIRLPRKVKQADFEPIVRQYVGRPSAKLLAVCDEIANAPGRLGILVETLRVASRIAAKDLKTDKPRITEEHVWKSIALRRQMMGETVYAKP